MSQAQTDCCNTAAMKVYRLDYIHYTFVLVTSQLSALFVFCVHPWQDTELNNSCFCSNSIIGLRPLSHV